MAKIRVPARKSPIRGSIRDIRPASHAKGIIKLGAVSQFQRDERQWRPTVHICTARKSIEIDESELVYGQENSGGNECNLSIHFCTYCFSELYESSFLGFAQVPGLRALRWIPCTGA